MNDAGGLVEVSCPICSSDRWTVMGHAEEHRIVRCRGCGLRYVSPRRTAPAIIEETYRPAYYADLRGREERSRAVARRYVDTVMRHCPVERPRVLDVGIGLGVFARAMRERSDVGPVEGVDVTEVNTEALERDGIRVHVGEIHELDLGEFDIITAHHVLEHVPDPIRFLAAVRGALSERGILHVVVPNEGSLSSRWQNLFSRLGWKSRPFRHLAPGHHLWFFRLPTLVTLLERCDFQVLAVRSVTGARRRNPLHRLVHRVLGPLAMSSWLEAVAARRSEP